ncbi:MAG: hypothetical protein IPJ86_14940 [Bacteroidetes bacterium]|nr:hypothetical protein [Bacteroidota bacterium]
MGNQKNALENANAVLDLKEILELSESIKHRCAKKNKEILPLAETLEYFKKDLNAEIQKRLQAAIDNVDTIIKNNEI